MNAKSMIRKVLISLIISFLSINIGIGVANAAMEKTKSYYFGDPTKQTLITLNISFGEKVIDSKVIYDSIEKVKDKNNIIVGPYRLDEKSRGETETNIFFINDNSIIKKYIKEVETSDKNNLKENKIIVGNNIKVKNKKSYKIRGIEYSIAGIVDTNFKDNRVNNSIFMSINDMKKVIKEPYISKEPFYLEIIINGKNFDKIADEIIHNINSLKNDCKVKIAKKTFTEDYKESISPSAYIISGFSLIILTLTIINLILVSSFIIEENYKNFAIMKALGSNEKMIFQLIIKNIIKIIFVSVICGYIGAFIIAKILNYALGLGIYIGLDNLVYSVILGIISCLISIIKPYFKIKKLNLTKFLKG